MGTRNALPFVSIHLSENLLKQIHGRRNFQRRFFFPFVRHLDSSDDAIISKNLDGLITSWNKSAERIFGYTADEAVGQPISILFPQDRLEEEPKILARIRKGERVDHFQTVRRTKDGKLLDISVTISSVRDAKGNIVGASKIVRDITPQLELQAQLRRSEEKFGIALASVGDAVIATDNEGRISFMNAVAEHLTGWTQADALMRSLPEVLHIVNEYSRTGGQSGRQGLGNRLDRGFG